MPAVSSSAHRSRGGRLPPVQTRSREPPALRLDVSTLRRFDGVAPTGLTRSATSAAPDEVDQLDGIAALDRRLRERGVAHDVPVVLDHDGARIEAEIGEKGGQR